MSNSYPWDESEPIDIVLRSQITKDLPWSRIRSYGEDGRWAKTLLELDWMIDKLIDWFCDWLIDWLNVLCFTPYRQHFSHITAATFHKWGSFVKFWSFPGGPHEPSLHLNPMKRSFACQGGCCKRENSLLIDWIDFNAVSAIMSEYIYESDN